MGGLRAHLAHQVDRHVVRRRERTAQRKVRWSPGRRSRWARRSSRAGSRSPPRARRRCRAARPARSAGCTPRRQRYVLFAVELDQLLQDDELRAGMLMPQSQCLGGEYRLDQSGGESPRPCAGNVGSILAWWAAARAAVPSPFVVQGPPGRRRREGHPQRRSITSADAGAVLPGRQPQRAA